MNTHGLTALFGEFWENFSEEQKQGLRNFFRDPSEPNWDTIQSYVLKSNQMRRIETIWMSLIRHVDRDYASAGRKEDADGNVLQPWKKVPTRAEIILAVRQARMTSGFGEIHFTIHTSHTYRTHILSGSRFLDCDIVHVDVGVIGRLTTVIVVPHNNNTVLTFGDIYGPDDCILERAKEPLVFGGKALQNPRDLFDVGFAIYYAMKRSIPEYSLSANARKEIWQAMRILLYEIKSDVYLPEEYTTLCKGA